MRDHILELPIHVARIAAPPFLAIDTGDHVQVVGIGELIGSDQAGPHHVAGIEVFALGRPQHAAHFHGLGITRADVIEDRVAKDVLARLLFGHVLGPRA